VWPSILPSRRVIAAPLEPALVWRAQGAWAAGLVLFAFETAQVLVLLPLLPRWLPVAEVTLWISLTAALGLVNAAAAAYVQPLVRNIASRGKGLPAAINWRHIMARTDKQGALLLVCMLGLFAMLLAWQVNVWSTATVAASSLFFVALALKLLALNRFVWLNGMGQIGRDKRILLTGSVITLVLALVLAPTTGSAWGLSLASLLGATVTVTLARRAASQLGHNAAGASVSWPVRAEMTSLVLLNLCGYLNVATDVLMANRFLPPSQAVSYAFWSRALFSFFVLAGMYTQIRFPTWAQSAVPPLRFELGISGLLMALLPVMTLLVYGLVNASPFGATLCVLPMWMLGALAVSSALGCAVVVAGQLANARGAYRFMLPSAVVAGCAPVLALMFANTWQPWAFVLGYLVANAVLLVINARQASLMLSTSAA
jgi:hypothetical protein